MKGRRTQASLFESEPEPGDECQYPYLSGLSGYQYGCRCERCCSGKRQANNSDLSPFCEVEGCTNHRLKSTRRCEEHPRRTVGRNGGAQLAGACCVRGCLAEWTIYESQLASRGVDQRQRGILLGICPAHRRKLRQQRIHRYSLDVRQVRFIIEAKKCDFCQERLGSDWVIDHDHRCCDAPAGSCGECVRGVLHNSCNFFVGKFEMFVAMGLLEPIPYMSRRLRDELRRDAEGP